MRWLAALALALTTAGCASHDTRTGGRIRPHPTVLRVAFPLSHLPGDLQIYADQVARRSHGTLAIHWVTAGHAGDPAFERDTIADVRAGRYPLGVVGSRAWDTPRLRALVAPLLITTDAQEERVLERGASRDMLSEVGASGVTGVALLPGPLRRMLGISKPFHSASDFRGARVGIQASGIAEATLRALGATAVARPATPQPAGLTGYEQQLGAIAGNEETRDARAITINLVLWPRPLVVFANAKALAALSTAQRRALIAAGPDSIAAMTAADEAEDRDTAAELCRAHFPLDTATPRELQTLTEAVRPVIRALARDPRTRTTMAAIRALASPAAPPLTCRAPAGSEPSRATVLDGVYTRSVTAAEQLRIDKASLPENYGRMVLVISNGRFAQTQSNRLACTWGYGTAVLRGNRLDWTFIDAGGHAPTGSLNQPGEHFLLKTTLYHDTLTLSTFTPSDLPPLTWHRTGRAPSLDALAPGCRPPPNALG